MIKQLYKRVDHPKFHPFLMSNLNEIAVTKVGDFNNIVVIGAEEPKIPAYHNFSFDKTTAFGMFGRLGALSDKVQITVKNTGGSAELVDILARPQSSKIQIIANSMPISQFANRLNANPMLLQGISIMSGNQDQLYNPILLIFQDMMGSYGRTTITPAASSSMYQSNPNMVEVKGLKFVIGVDGSIQTTINPGTTVSYILDVKQMFNDQKSLNKYKNFLEQKRYRNFMRIVSY